MDRDALKKLPYKKIQRLAKTHGIRANEAKEKIIENLLKTFHGGPVPTNRNANQIQPAKKVEQGPADAGKEVEGEAETTDEPELGAQEVVVAPHAEEGERLDIPSHWSMAPVVSESTMFPLRHSPVGRLRPADFTVSGHCSAATSSTDSMSSPSTCVKSPDGRPTVPGAFSPRPMLRPPTREKAERFGTSASRGFVPPADWNPSLCVPAGSASVLEPRPALRLQQRQQPVEAEDGDDEVVVQEVILAREFQSGAVRSAPRLQQQQQPEAEEDDDDEVVVQEVIPAGEFHSGAVRPTMPELRDALRRVEALAGERGGFLKDIQNLKKAIRILQAKDKANEIKIRKVQAMRKAIQQRYIGEENLPRLAEGGDGQSWQRLLATSKRRAQGQANESPSKRRRMMGA